MFGLGGHLGFADADLKVAASRELGSATDLDQLAGLDAANDALAGAGRGRKPLLRQRGLRLGERADALVRPGERPPLWTATDCAPSEGEETASVEEPFHLGLEMAFTVPESGSGRYTTSISSGADVYESGRASWSATRSNEDGTVLDEVEIIETYAELSARDVAPGCEPGVVCTARVYVDLVPTVGTVTLTWEATFTARDNVPGERRHE